MDQSSLELSYSLKGLYFCGNAPARGGWLGIYRGDCVIYYSPGTTGWPPVPEPWEGHTTALWQWRAVVQDDGGVGVQTNRFGFNIISPSGMTAVVEASSDLTSNNWAPVATNVLTEGSIYFGDPEWTNFPGRFYRIRSR